MRPHAELLVAGMAVLVNRHAMLGRNLLPMSAIQHWFFHRYRRRVAEAHLHVAGVARHG